MSEGQSPRELKTIDIGGRPPIRRDNGNVDLELEGETRFNAEQNKKRIKDGVKEVQIATKARFDEELVTQVGEGTIIRPFMRDPFATWKNEDPENGIIYAAKLTAQPTPKAEDKYDITGKNLELRIGKRAEGKVAPIADIAVGFGINGYPEHLNLSLPLDVAQLKNTLVRVFDDIYAGRSQFSAPASVRIKASEYPYPDRLLKYEELPHLPFFERIP